MKGKTMAPSKKAGFGDLPPRHSFMMNPYPEQRLSRCPMCERRTGPKKVPLLIHVDPHHLIALNYTCRYCKECDLLIAHKLEIEHHLAGLFRTQHAEAIGNDYLIIGTVEKSCWQAGLTQPRTTDQMRRHASDFATCYKELRMTRPGYYRADQKPPIAEPPASAEWIKAKTDPHRS